MSESAGRSDAARRVIARCHEIASITDVAGETTRTFLSPASRRVQELIGGWMRAAGMAVHVDAAGNLRGVLAAKTNSDTRAPRLLVGSHLDTVPNAGAFDGVLGVVLGVTLVEELLREKTAPSLAIEVIGFSEEEGVRFAKPFLGSLALVGKLDAAMLKQKDAAGVSIAEAIRGFGLDPAELQAVVADAAAFGYFEFHIEQGPVLESEGRGLGVVEAIVGQTRMTLRFVGRANHAGTTPMGPLRHDALAAAAEWVCEVERYALTRSGLVATVGRLETVHGAGNVIAGEVVATLDVRHGSDEVRYAAAEHCVEAARTAAERRAVTVSHAISLDQAAVPMDAALTAELYAAAEQATGIAPRRMASGAGHDAMIVARHVPSAMLFLRSPGGLSHHPDEAVLEEDVEAALNTGVEFLLSLRGDTILERTRIETKAQ